MVAVCVAHIIVSNFSVFFAFKMSRSSVNKNLSDRYVILLDESLKENQALREELKEREAQNVAKIERLSSKVNTLYQLLEKADHTSGKGKRTSNISSNVHIPARCYGALSTPKIKVELDDVHTHVQYT